MSLNVYLFEESEKEMKTCHCCGHESETDGEVFEGNITHNLSIMSDAAGIYKHLWRPEEIGITKAEQLIDPLEKAVELLTNSQDRFVKFNPENGWGNYAILINFVSGYLEACKEYPNSKIQVSR